MLAMNNENMNTLKFNEIVKRIQILDNTNGQFTPLKIAFLRNITIDPTITYLRFFCYEENIRADILMGEYDNVIQEAINGESPLYRHTPDIIVLCLKKENLCPELTNQFNALSREAIDEKVNAVLAYFRIALSAIKKNSEAIVLVHGFEIPVYPSFGVLDCQDHHRQLGTFRSINNEILSMVHEHEGVYLIDMDIVQSTLGYANYFDSRYWHIGKAPYTRAACKAIAQEYLKVIRALKGKNRKCLALDCDNTLWGGIIGEDGMEKISLGKTYPGSAFLEFQNAVLDLYHRGVLLAICSKNNERDVLQVLEQHPDMVLRKEHFVSMKINWNDKVSNLKEMAEELNIGLDSFVFMDDSEFEINMIRQVLPEVKSIILSDDPSTFPNLLKSCGLFDSLAFSEEDRKRSEMYRAEADRRQAASSMSHLTLEEYMRYLEMEVSIRNADDFAIPRISQLTQRTNQFNLTTKRYSEAEIMEFCAANDVDVRYLRLKDRFGDSGIVGVSILKYVEMDCFIDTFLLSCRVIGRGIEDAFLADCRKLAKKRNCKQMFGTYSTTKKNGQVESFYANRGFIRMGENGIVTQYLFSADNSLAYPDYFKAVQSDVEGIPGG
jgi:FkbH-like protein